MNILYGWVALGGLLVATNVHVSHPAATMEYVMDWNLIYRDSAQTVALRPDRVTADDVLSAPRPGSMSIWKSENQMRD